MAHTSKLKREERIILYNVLQQLRFQDRSRSLIKAMGYDGVLLDRNTDKFESALSTLILELLHD